MTEIFLEMWEYATRVAVTDHMHTAPPSAAPAMVAVLRRHAADDVNVGETVYMQIINNARDYVYITTPYLVLDNEMITALTTAAQSGVGCALSRPASRTRNMSIW